MALTNLFLENMKFNTIILKSLLLLFITSLIGCDSNSNEVELIEPNHRVIYTSEMDFDNTIQVNGRITFADASQGVIDRKWSFPEGIVDVMNSDNNVDSKEATVITHFNTVGEHNVNLNQHFKGNAYVDNSIKDQVLDTTIVVKVIDSVKASISGFTLQKDGETPDYDLSIGNDIENEVTASRYVEFNYETTGEPQEFEWHFEGGSPNIVKSGDLPVKIQYRRLGSFDVNFIASRVRPRGGDTLVYSNMIKVIPSTDPVNLENVIEKNGKIGLVFSREMSQEGLNPATFGVKIENGTDVFTPSVSRVSIDSDEGNIVLLELNNEMIYNDDVVKVSYTPGELKTMDAVNATAFTDRVLTEFTSTVNLYDNYTFDYTIENSLIDNFPYLSWGGVWGMFSHDISQEKSRSGSNSLKINFEANGGMIVGLKDASGSNINFTLEQGKTYELGYWIYLDEFSWTRTGNQWNSDIRFYPSNWAFEQIPTTFVDGFPTGKWVYQKSFFTSTFTGEITWLIRGYNESNSDPVTFYLDDFVLAEVQLRP